MDKKGELPTDGNNRDAQPDTDIQKIPNHNIKWGKIKSSIKYDKFTPIKIHKILKLKGMRN